VGAYGFDSRYIFITGMVRALETKMVSSDIVSRLLECNDSEMGMDILRNRIFGEFFRGNRDTSSYLELIRWRKEWLYSFIRKYVFHKEVNVLLRMKYDYHNLRVLIKDKIFEINNSDIVVDYGLIQRDDIISIIMSEDYPRLNYSMENSVYEAVDLWYTYGNLYLMDFAFDRHMFIDYITEAEKTGSEYIRGYISLKADLLNIQFLVRTMGQPDLEHAGARMFMPGGKIDIENLKALVNGPFHEIEHLAEEYDFRQLAAAIADLDNNPFAVERESENITTNYLRETQSMVSSVEPVFAFAKAVELELKILGMILYCLDSRVPWDLINKRLPELYQRRA